MRKKPIFSLDPDQLKRLFSLGAGGQDPADEPRPQVAADGKGKAPVDAASGERQPPDKEGSSASATASPVGIARPGSQIGRFRIKQEMGRGGMGVVYLAHDTHLGRSVALKTLPPEIGENRELLSRLRREAKILASLNHPNIATIHEELEEGGIIYLVLEYIAGDTLAERLSRGPLALAEALSVGLQVAEALAAAHNQSVIHRDLKPGNIKITAEGKVKVLDFGLAKAGAGQCPGLHSTATEAGRLFGTPAYMSPEQARSQEVDSRGDIWSFGCVLYEMLTGDIPFLGETSSDTLANVLHKEPNWQVLPPTTPPNIQVLLRRCLEKDPRSRLQNMGDAVIEIRETLSPPLTVPPATRPISAPPAPGALTQVSLRKVVMVIGAAILMVAAVIAAWLVSKKPSVPPSKEIRLVVLPFENLGPAKEDYIATGIAGEISDRLAGLHGLAVISRRSAMQCKKGQKTARQIAADLRVDYILEGTVQRERPLDPTSRVRIIPRLVKAADDAQVWAQSYDNDPGEVFRVQSDLAERVAQALHVTLIERERRALWSRPTENMEAYDYYLRGKEYWHRGYAKQNWMVAIQMFERAVELDPEFALAYAQLSRCHAALYWDRHDPTAERLEMAKRAVDRALELAPDLPEAHWALGHYYYRGHLDYDRALEQFAIAQKDLPNDSDLLTGIHYIQRRQGKFEEALANIKRASELDPLSNIITYDLQNMFRWMRNYPEALRCCDRAISLAPDLPEAYGRKASLYLRWEGSTEKARAVVEEAVKHVASPEEFSISWQLTFAVYEGDYPRALGALSLKSEDIDDLDDFVPRAMRYASIYTYMNEKERAKECYDEGRKILEAKVQQQPDDSRFHSTLGIAYAGLGRKEDAIREGNIAVNLLPITKDAIRGYYRATDLARIYVMVGEFDLAMEQIEFLLSIPGDLSKPLLRLHPAWASLREHPRFKKLVGTAE